MTAFFDSVTPQNISNTAIVAAYFNGKFAWPVDEVNLHPSHILISVLPNAPEIAQFTRALDVERFDATPADVVPFIEYRHHSHPAHGHDATIYVNAANRAEVEERAHAAGLLAGKDYRLWVAHWTNDPFAREADMTGVWAIQYRNTPGYDVSVLTGADDFTPRG